MPLPRNILVPTDYSEHADHALAYAAELGRPLAATLHLVHAILIPAAGLPELGIAYSASALDAMTKTAQMELDARAARYRDRVAFGQVQLEIGDPRDVIVRVARELAADLIVMGTHGRRGIRRALLGSVAESVVRSAPCPVLTVPRPGRSPTAPNR